MKTDILQNVRALLHPVALDKVFTPTSAADLNYVKRSRIETNFHNNFQMRGKSFIIFGPSGSGKTSFLNRYIFEHHIDVVKIHCDSKTSFQSLMNEVFDKLGQYYKKEFTVSNQRKLSGSAKTGLAGADFGINTEASTGESTRFDRYTQPQLTKDALADALGKSKKTLVIEDGHKMPNHEKHGLEDVIKQFSDSSIRYPTLRIVIIGEGETAQEVLALDDRQGDRIYQCKIPPLSSEEIKEIVLNGCRLLNVELGDEIVRSIVRYSNSSAAIAHELCYHLCSCEGIDKTKRRRRVLSEQSLFDKAVDAFFDSRKSTMQRMVGVFEREIRNNAQRRNILGLFIEKPNSSIPLVEIVNQGKRKDLFSEQEAKSILAALSGDKIGILCRHPDLSYSFSTPLWATYIHDKMTHATIGVNKPTNQSIGGGLNGPQQKIDELIVKTG